MKFRRIVGSTHSAYIVEEDPESFSLWCWPWLALNWMRALCIGSDYANAADARGKQRAKREKERGLMGRDCGRTVEEELGKALKSLRGGEESFVKTPDAVCVCVALFPSSERDLSNKRWRIIVNRTSVGVPVLFQLSCWMVTRPIDHHHLLKHQSKMRARTQFSTSRSCKRETEIGDGEMRRGLTQTLGTRLAHMSCSLFSGT